MKKSFQLTISLLFVFSSLAFSQENLKKNYKAIFIESAPVIDGLLDDMLGKEDKRQGITRSPEVTVTQRLGPASWYVSSRFGKITKTETELIFRRHSLQS